MTWRLEPRDNARQMLTVNGKKSMGLQYSPAAARLRYGADYGHSQTFCAERRNWRSIRTV